MNALSAVIKDAENFNVDKYIFVGDYCANFPFPNEVVDAISVMNNAVVVKGNEEDYLIEYSKQDQSTWIDGQFQALYWLYKNLTEKNHIYLRGLPNVATINNDDIKISIAHKSSDFYGNVEYSEFSPQRVTEKYEKYSNPRIQLLRDIQAFMDSNADFHNATQSLTDDVYIFGHTHIQWHAGHENKVFINPGSCGFPLDGVTGAPYTVLEIENNEINIIERRVLYDIDKLKLDLKNSSLYKAAPVWIKVILGEIDTKFDYAMSFLQFAESYANKINDHIRPFSKKTWTEAFNLWSVK
jgi:predicted phosphodiesterase